MEAPDDTFTHDSLIYDLSKVRVLVRPDKAFLLPIKELLWVLNHDTPDEDRIFHAKFRYPLLVTKWRGKWTVVDGLHRLERYRRKGITVIPVKNVSAQVLAAARVHKTV
jgi:hypothetical protein